MNETYAVIDVVVIGSDGLQHTSSKGEEVDLDARGYLNDDILHDIALHHVRYHPGCQGVAIYCEGDEVYYMSSR